MSDAIKNWLPITKRNRVALGFAVLALVMFVTWNLLPYYQPGPESFKGVYMTRIWVIFVDLDFYPMIFTSPVFFAAYMVLLLNGLVALAIVPFWKILHFSNYLRIPLAVVNFAGGSIFLSIIFEEGVDLNGPYRFTAFLLVTLTMFALSAALFIFKNELGLRHELEVKKRMSGGFLR